MKLDFIARFKAAHKVSTPLITVRTFDNKSTIERIKAIWKDAPKESAFAMVAWDCVNGLVPITLAGQKKLERAMNDAGTPPEITPQMASALRCLGFIGDDCIVFMANAHLFWTEATHIQGIWNLRDKFKSWGSTLVLLTGNGAILPAELSNDFLALDEPLPTKDDLHAIVLTTFEDAKLPAPSADVLEQAIKALIGLPAFPAEQSTAMCLDTTSKTLNVPELWERKRQSINQTRGLSVLQTDANLDNLGGLAQFKQYLERIMSGNNPPNVILLWDEIEKSFAGMGTDTSGTTTKLGGNVLTWSNDIGMMGIIALGVPGAGKSEVVKAIANKYGKLCIAFNLADMESGLVGSSNEYLRNAQAVIDAISDKKVLSIATCNKVDSISPELKRRFANKGIFFFDAPTDSERASIWDIYRTKYSISPDDKLPTDTGWTGAEIRNCTINASELKISLQDASDYVIPVTQSDAGTIEMLRRSCSGKYLSASNPGTYSYDGPETQETASGRKIR